jgi:DNA replication ATP-dependent helicase Dna2
MTLAETLYKYILRICADIEATDHQKVAELYGYFDRVYADAVRQEKIKFSTLFARVGYVALKFHFTEEDTLLAQTFRKQYIRALETQKKRISPKEMHIAIAALVRSIERIYGVKPTPEVRALIPEDITLQLAPANITESYPQLSVMALRFGDQADVLMVMPDLEDSTTMQMLFNLPDRNQNFQPTIEVIRKITGFPVQLNLIDCGVDSEGRLRPRAIIIEPDYLFDISAIAECFQHDATEPFNFLIKKFISTPASLPMLVGNVANYFLDRLMSERPAPSFDQLFLDAFKANPMQFALLSDQETKDLRIKCMPHYRTLVSMTAGGFKEQGIEPTESLIEPSFYSAKYGIQGRLDLFHQGRDKMSIVELKSGSVFHPNSYGLARTHFTQTLLYGLLIESVYEHVEPRKAIAKYILYSGQEATPLRFAPDVINEQMESLQVRNQILGLEFLLTGIDAGQVYVPILDRMARSQVKAKGFTLEAFREFAKGYSTLNEVERKYFNSFVGFIAREHWYSRAGAADTDKKGGHATLWRQTMAEKEAQYAILGYLKQIENRSDTPEKLLIFQKTAQTNPMANFREGDIVLMYPVDEQQGTVLSHQINKGTLVRLSGDEVHVRLRYQQFHKSAFETEHLWHLEPDSMEMGFTSQYQSLFRWACAAPDRRALLLGASAPRQYADRPPLDHPDGMLNDQFEILKEIVAAKDYYLLWGPPGTGKTSVMLRHLSNYWYRKTNETVLYLAFTNRAVDEICESLEAIHTPGEDLYFRIGTEMSTDVRFRSRLLEQKIKTFQTRQQIKDSIKSYRIVVSTVSSMQTQDAVFEMLKFDRVVIDEASQLLEPQLLGLLTRCKRALLIGDHRQLPAVCTQQVETSVINDKELQDLGLCDMRSSYFERMYLHATKQGWSGAYGRLRFQGRMHRDIMEFPAKHFYSAELEIIPTSSSQEEIMSYHDQLVVPSLPQELMQQRVVFWPTPTGDKEAKWQKTNALEAQRVLELYHYFRDLYAANQLEWGPQTFGVITPWRAQIAAIKSIFAEGDTETDHITIDTVERYQGGAREIIIISLCTHSAEQMQSLVSLSEEGVDRKLNVALTRARKHLILLGNKEILMQNTNYAALIETYGV